MVGIDRIVADTTLLAAIPAPAGDEERRLEWLERRLSGAPGRRARDEVGNLVWTFGAPPYDLLLLVHVDTVFGSEVDHTPVERDGWLHGPGVGDNSVAVAATVEVVERVAGVIDRPFAVVFTVGEEGLGSLRGARHACATIECRAAIALEGHGLDQVYADAVGCVRARLAVTGPGGHSWWDRGRPSAVHELVRLLDELRAAVPPGLAFNVGRIEGGTTVNAIAATATAVLEGRALTEPPLERFAALLDAVSVPSGLALTTTVLDRRPSGRIDDRHPLMRAVTQVRAGLGLPVGRSDGSTDANAALALGIPAMALGCVRGADMHALTERIDLSSLELGATHLEQVLRIWLAPAGPITPTKEAS